MANGNIRRRNVRPTGGHFWIILGEVRVWRRRFGLLSRKELSFFSDGMLFVERLGTTIGWPDPSSMAATSEPEDSLGQSDHAISGVHNHNNIRALGP
jgi:hypothetical protein